MSPSTAQIFQHCLGGGGEGSIKRTKRTRCVSFIRVEVPLVKFSIFRPILVSVPKCFDQDCRSSRN